MVINVVLLHVFYMYFVPKLCSKRWFKSCLKYKFRMVGYG